MFSQLFFLLLICTPYVAWTLPLSDGAQDEKYDLIMIIFGKSSQYALALVRVILGTYTMYLLVVRWPVRQ